jgi:hypothetical protein
MMAPAKLVGRKRHMLVDAEGLLLAVNVHPANVMDRDGIKSCPMSPRAAVQDAASLDRRWVQRAREGGRLDPDRRQLDGPTAPSYPLLQTLLGAQ